MVKLVRFPKEISEKILHHLKEIMKQKPYDLIIHEEPSDLTNAANLLNNVNQILQVISKDSYQQNWNFHN